jgi:adenosylmethionine-8-amino-7-oxononanoate aminotransferase
MVLEGMESESIHERVRGLEETYRSALEPLREHPSTFDVRGIGALWGVELAEDRSGKPFARERRVAERVFAGCRTRGVLVHTGSGCADGTRGDFVVIAPPLTIDEESIGTIARALEESIAEAVRAT